MRNVAFAFVGVTWVLAAGLTGCDDPFEGQLECSQVREIDCESGYKCIDNHCEQVCAYARECLSPTQACTDGICAEYNSECDPADAAPCAEGWFCDLNVCRKQLEIGQLCGDALQCWSGVCIDSVCCNDYCDGECMSCRAAGTGLAEGTCGPVLAGGDPREDCFGSLGCDGAGACLAGDPGDPCESDAECAASFCVDGVCCESACADTCRACTEAATGEPGGTCADVLEGLPDEACGAAACNGAGQCWQEPVGASCTEGFQCSSGFCTDGFCCNAACTAACEACADALTGAGNGTCAVVLVGLDRAADDGDCPGASACDGAGACFARAQGEACQFGYECARGNCVDGFCCDGPCEGTCMRCDGQDTVPGTPGSCEPVADGSDPDDECTGTLQCRNRGGVSGQCWDRPAAEACQEDYECQSNFCCGAAASAACQPDWQVMESPTTEDLTDVWGDSGANVWAVGANRTVLTYDGAFWTGFSGSVSSIGVDLVAVSGFGSMVTAVGHGGTTERSLVELSGGNLAEATFDAAVPTSALNDVWVVSATEAYAVGDGGVIVERTGAGVWTWAFDPASPLIPFDHDLTGIWVDADGSVYVIGMTPDDDPFLAQRGVVLRRDGVSGVWTSLGFDTDIGGIGVGANAGMYGLPVVFNGSVWATRRTAQGLRLGHRYPLPDGPWMDATIPMYPLWAGADYVHGPTGLADSGQLVRFDGSNAVSDDAGHGARGMWGLGGSDCELFAVTGSGVVLRR